MNPTLEDKYLRLEETRNRLLDELESLDATQLNDTTAADKWSINQHVAHLALVDEVALEKIRYKLQQQDQLQNISLKQCIKALLPRVALKSGKKYKAPAQVATVPETSNLPELRQRWDTVRFQLEDELTLLPEQLLNKGVFKHPHIGYLNMNQTLIFLQDHFDHHVIIIQQLKSDFIKQ